MQRVITRDVIKYSIKSKIYLILFLPLIYFILVLSSCDNASEQAKTECRRFKNIVNEITHYHVMDESILIKNRPLFLKNAVIEFLTFYQAKTDTPLSANLDTLCTQAIDVVIKKTNPQIPSSLTRDLLNFYLKQIDPHSQALTIQEITSRGRPNGKGLGFTVGHLILDPLRKNSSLLDNNTAIFEVEDVVAGGPADLAHLYEGMKFRILKIDGKAVQGIPVDPNPFIEQAQELELVPIENDKPLPSISLTSKEFTVVPCEYRSFESTKEFIAYIKLRSFLSAEGCFNSALQYFLEKKANALILDLRGNFGDDSYATLQIGKQLIFNGKGKAFVGRFTPHFSFPNITKFEDADSIWNQDNPIIVLVNDRTRSIAEVLAGALQDYGSLIVGTATFGKGTELSLYYEPMRKNGFDGGLLLTDAFFIRPSGQIIQEKGIIPDIVLNPSTSHSNQREANYPKALKAPQDQNPLSGYEPSDLLKNKMGGSEFLITLQHTVDALVSANSMDQSYEKLELEVAKQVAIEYVRWKALRSDE